MSDLYAKNQKPCIVFRRLAILLTEKKFDSIKVMLFDNKYLHIWFISEKIIPHRHKIFYSLVGNVWQQLDPDIFKYIDMPVGTRLIRISPEAFEIDENNKKIYMTKR